MPDLLIEIGVEEIPAPVVLPALEQMQTFLEAGLRRLRLAHGPIYTYGTPRRLAALVEEVAERQPDEQKEIKGPPAQAAFDEKGQPTQAARGFAARWGLPVEALTIQETDKGAFVFASVKEEGRRAVDVLPQILAEMMEAFSFPKTLRWGDRPERFARPVRWLVGLLGEEILDWEFAGVKAGRNSRGHRFLSPGEALIRHPKAYLDTLRAHYVIANHEERRARIRSQAIETAARVGGRPQLDPELLEENNFLVEWPSCLLGSFPERYLQLPAAVLITVMEKHQRYFPVLDAQGQLLPYFIIVRNGEGPGEDIIRQGNEKVIIPRLEDAEFYLTEDLKTPLPARQESLKRVTFMECLGTLYDKTQRLVALTGWLAEQLHLAAEKKQIIERAAWLAKCDLVTMMIADGKLAALQGVIGGHYAALAGEPPEVAQAIAEHYQPVRPDEPAPASLAGKILALADKLDNLAAAFALGLIPKGTRDPQGLRRQAQGVLKILQAGDFPLRLKDLLQQALQLLPPPQPRPKQALSPEEALAALQEFFLGRIEAQLEEEGLPYDTVRAVLASVWQEPVEVMQRAHALQQIRQTAADFEAQVDTATRPANIWRGTDVPADVTVNTELFADPAEADFWATFLQIKERVQILQQSVPRDYEAIWHALCQLQKPIEALFKAVMINAEDQKLRYNRLAMMRELDQLYLQLADFTQIVQ